MLAAVGKYLAVKLLTEAFLKSVCLATAEHFAGKTQNKLDDKIVQSLKDALE